MVEPQRLQPRGDLSVRTMLARIEGALAGVEERTKLQFDNLNEKHNGLATQVAAISTTVNATAAAVARIDGERAGERRSAHDVPSLPRRMTLWTAILAALTAIAASASGVWHFLSGHAPVAQ